MATTTSRCECVLPVSCKCESRRWRDVFKDQGYDDLLAGTTLAEHGNNYNFGLFAVRKGFNKEYSDEFYSLLKQDFDGLCKKDQDAKNENRKRKAVEVSPSKKLKDEYPGYETFQCTSKNCSCKYDYAKTNGHLHYRTEDLIAPNMFVDALNVVGRNHQCSVNEVVANGYSPSQRTPPHNDYSPIYARCTSIVSATFGNIGIFVWKVRPASFICGETVAGFENQHPLWQKLGGKKKGGDGERQRMIKELGYAGAVSLDHGDILVMEGTFQTHFEHETLVIDSISSLEDLLARYPATIRQSQDLLKIALCSKPVFDKRLNLTARLISNHKAGCCNHISSATICHQPNALTVGIVPRPPAQPRPPDKTQVALRSYRPCQCPPPPPPPHPPF